MEIKLTHPFLFNCHDLNSLLDVNKFSSFCRKLEQQSIISDFYPSQDYKGDGFEFFCEALIKLSPIDNRLGINNYKINLNTAHSDYGVDGYGLGINAKPATVQCKYRSDHSWKLKYNDDHLSNFTNQSFIDFSVDPRDQDNMLIITSAAGIHYTVENILRKKVRCLGYEDLRKRVDNNPMFWNTLRELVEYSKK